MKIGVIVGHSILKNGSITSANSSFCNEYLYCKELGEYIRKLGEKTIHKIDIIQCPEKVFNKAREEKDYKLGKINGKKYDMILELHLNSSSNTSATGTEVLYYSEKGKVIADRIYKKVNPILNKKRGIKKRTDLYILRDTDCPATLLELFFLSNIEDFKTMENYKKENIARLILEGLIGEDIKDNGIEEIYRVRRSWSDTKSQIGAYKNLDNAFKNCKEGYKVYNSKGIEVTN